MVNGKVDPTVELDQVWLRLIAGAGCEVAKAGFRSGFGIWPPAQQEPTGLRLFRASWGWISSD